MLHCRKAEPYQISSHSYQKRIRKIGVIACEAIGSAGWGESNPEQYI
jgi:hypothetical protein